MKQLLLLQFILYSCVNTAHDNSWTQLFNGNDLTGWEILNGKAEIKSITKLS